MSLPVDLGFIGLPPLLRRPKLSRIASCSNAMSSAILSIPIRLFACRGLSVPIVWHTESDVCSLRKVCPIAFGRVKLGVLSWSKVYWLCWWRLLVVSG